jgi:hypothetical protein
VVGLLLLLGLFWYWASTLIGDDDNDPGNITPTVAIVIDSTETATVTATVGTGITATEGTGQNVDETPTVESGTDETPTEEATEDTGEPVSNTFEVDESVATTEGGINFRSAPDSSDDTNVIDTLDAGTELTITGPAVEGDDGNIWWPVNDPASGEDGYVVEDYLETLSS